MKKIFVAVIGAVLTLSTLNSCRDKDLDPTLAQAKDISTGITSVGDLKAVLSGSYDFLSDFRYYGRDYIIYGEVRSDNTFANGNSNRFVSPAEFNMNADDAYARDTWTYIYKAIANANVVIGKENAPISGDATEIKHYVGEAYAIRALAHFDLVKIYGQQHVGTGGMTALGVPYVTTFKDQNSLFPARNTVQEVYTMAQADLDKAISLMNNNLTLRNNNYINTAGAWALKARIALYFKDYPTAETAAKKVIDYGRYVISTPTSFPTTFSGKNATNVIFGIAASNIDNMGINGLAQIYRMNASGGGYGDIVALKDLFSVYQTGDVRASAAMIVPNGTSGMEYRNKGKYPDNAAFADDIPLIRYEEVVLTYAEALLMNNKAGLALTELNKIPAQRGSAPYAAATLDNILLERRKELAFEGFRFFDLMRTGKNVPLVDALRQRFGATIPYGATKLAFPIPNAEKGVNSKIVQNQGYK